MSKELDKNIPVKKKEFSNSIIYFSSLSASVLGGVFYFLLNIKGYIPIVLWVFSILMLCNLVILKKTKKINVFFFLTTGSIFVCSYLVSIMSGGITSPFVFFMPIIVVSGYVISKAYGRLWLAIITMALIIVSFQTYYGALLKDEVPVQFDTLFSVLTLFIALIVLGGIIGGFVSRSIYSLNKAKKEIEESDYEKQIMLKEIHHRVKNNLQIIISLLKLQGGYLKNQEEEDLFKESQARIHSMALTHETLYKSSDLSKIGYNIYVDRLVRDLMRNESLVGKDVKINLSVPELYLKLDTAIPLGLLINEIVSNSINHGFNGLDKGEIYVELTRVNGDEYFLLIGDNGLGFPKELDFDNCDTFGLELIKMLAEQLNGTIKKLDKSGTHYALKFIEIELSGTK